MILPRIVMSLANLGFAFGLDGLVVLLLGLLICGHKLPEIIRIRMCAIAPDHDSAFGPTFFVGLFLFVLLFLLLVWSRVPR